MLSVPMRHPKAAPERLVALNLDVPWSTKKRLRAVAHELEDLEKKATMTSVLVHLVAAADARAIADHFPDVVVRRRRRSTTARS